MPPIKVLLVDDHAVVRAGYRRFLEAHADVQVVAEADSAEAGYGAFSRCRPDVSIVDLAMPGLGGLELIRRILAREPDAALLVFSMHDESLFAMRALEAGAKGYVTKGSAPEVLVEAVRQVARRKLFLSPDVMRELALRQVTREQDPVAALSAREFEIFRLLTEGQSVARIAETLSLSQKSVANYQTHIKQKLGVETTAGLVHLAIRCGIIRTPKE